MEYLVTIEKLKNVVRLYIGDLQKKKVFGRDTWFDKDGNKPLFYLSNDGYNFGIDEGLYNNIRSLLNLKKVEDDNMVQEVLDKLGEDLVGHPVTLHLF